MLFSHVLQCQFCRQIYVVSQVPRYSNQLISKSKFYILLLVVSKKKSVEIEYNICSAATAILFFFIIASIKENVKLQKMSICKFLLNPAKREKNTKNKKCSDRVRTPNQFANPLKVLSPLHHSPNSTPQSIPPRFCYNRKGKNMQTLFIFDNAFFDVPQGMSKVWYQGILKGTVSGVFEDLKFKISEGSDQN